MQHHSSQLSNLDAAFMLIPNELESYDIVNFLVYGNLNMSLVGFQPLLSLKERATASKISSKRHRNNFVFRRTLLRKLLGSIMNIPAKDVHFDAQAHKPYVINGPFFSHSNKPDCLIYSFSTSTKLGVDIEPIEDGIDVDGIAKLFFSSSEKQAIAAASENEKNQSFIKIWTIREAITKCLGKSWVSSTDYEKQKIHSWTIDSYQIAIASQKKLSSLKTFIYRVDYNGKK
ncbi:MAG: hypothetical protein KR126chlam1_00803 [Chlamydiae bacterium]|nr:hypothetical protein [Chlamydiota bacterium]